MSVDTRGCVRISLQLPEKDFDAGKKLAERRGVSFTEMIRGAIATEQYLRDAQAAGARIIIEDPIDGVSKEIIFFK